MLGPETPCEQWITEDDLCCDLTGIAPEVVAGAIDFATVYLYERTCRRWPGVNCTATVRPCISCECCMTGWTGWGYSPPPAPWSDACRCRWPHLTLQAPYPILEILAFDIAGVNSLADVRLDSNREATLLESSGLSCFPSQDLSAADGAPGTWSMRYRFGAAPIEPAKRAAGDLACELLRTCPGGDCEQPDNVEAVIKRGVTVRFRLPIDGATNVKTADWLIDAYGCQTTGTSRIIDPSIRPHVYRGP